MMSIFLIIPLAIFLIIFGFIFVISPESDFWIQALSIFVSLAGLFLLPLSFYTIFIWKDPGNYKLIVTEKSIIWTTPKKSTSVELSKINKVSIDDDDVDSISLFMADGSSYYIPFLGKTRMLVDTLQELIGKDKIDYYPPIFGTWK